MKREIIPINISRGWMPDYAPFAMPDGGLVICSNLWPYDEFYSPVFSASAYSSSAVSGTPLSAVETYSAADNKYYSFIGTTTKLYRLDTVILTDITRLSGAYTTGSNRWYFAPHGEVMVATNFDDLPQILTPNLAATNFRDLGGSPPRAKYCISFRGRILLAYLQDADGTIRPNRIIWSDYENIENYKYSPNGSDYQDIVGGNSPITGFAQAGSIFLVGHRHSISRGFLSNNALNVFDIDRHFVSNIGMIEGSLIVVDNIAYFFDERNIYMFDGQIVTPIGDGIKRTFLNYLDILTYYKITPTYEPRNGCILWNVVSTANKESGIPDKMLVYNPRAKRFALIESQQYCIWNFHRGAMDLDTIGALYPDLDQIPYSLDSNIWIDNSPLLAAVTVDNKVSVFQSSVMNWTFETGEYKNKDGLLYINNIRPNINRYVGAINVKIGYRLNDDDDLAYTETKTVNSKGFANFMQAGRYLRINCSGGFHEGLIGLEAMGKLIQRR